MKNTLSLTKTLALSLTLSMTLFGMIGCGEETDATGTDSTNTEETSDTSDATTDETNSDDTSATDDSTDTTDETETTDETTDETDTTDETTTPTDTTEETGTEIWGALCASESDCASPTDICVMQPGASEGYCSIQCEANQICYDAGAPDTSWTCNAVFSCTIASQTWCGPTSEVGQGPIIECE